MRHRACDIARILVNRRLIRKPRGNACPVGELLRWMRVGWVGALVVFGLTFSSALAGAEEDVRAAVNRYFQVWSAQDMKSYEDCFHPDAVILFVSGDGRLIRNMRGPFIESQRLAHASSPQPMKEVPTRIQILTSAEYASALVHWELTTAGGIKRGVDVFSYVKQGKDWKIGSLVFGDEKE